MPGAAARTLPGAPAAALPCSGYRTRCASNALTARTREGAGASSAGAARIASTGTRADRSSAPAARRCYAFATQTLLSTRALCRARAARGSIGAATDEPRSDARGNESEVGELYPMT
jgi:hypothetical protein